MIKRCQQRLLIIALLLTCPFVWAKDNAFMLKQKTYEVVNQAQTDMAAENYASAERPLKALLYQTKLAAYDKAVVQQTLGYLYSATEQYSLAITSFQQALQSNALPEKVSHNLRYNLAQLLMADERIKAGVSLLEQWMVAEANPTANARVLLANGYYQLQQFSKAASQLQQAIAMEAKPQESWYQLLLAAELERKNYRAAIPVLETLISDFPYQKNYWTQLSALYMQQDKDVTALAVKALSQRLEIRDSRVLLSLADMYRYLHIPYKAAKLLQQGINDSVIDANQQNLTRLADSWIAAREITQATQVLKRLIDLDDSGDSELKYGRLLFDQQQWSQAATALSSALSSLKGQRRGMALLLLAMTQFELMEYEKARDLFVEAKKYQQQREQAQYWLDYLHQFENVTSSSQSES